MTTELRIENERFERAEPSVIRAYQWERLRALLPRVWETNAFYRERWRAAGVALDRIDSLEAFSRLIPTVEKKDFVADQREHPPFGRRLEHAIGLGERLEIYTTSGTSGQGVEVHAQTVRELTEMQAMYRYLFRWAGLHPGDHVFLTLPVTMLGGGRIEYQGALGYGLTVYTVGNESAERKLELLRRFRPRALYGSSSYFGHLAAVANESPPARGLRVLLTGLEGAGFSYLSRLEDLWHARVADRFGCTQLRSDNLFTCEQGIGPADRPGMLHNLDPFVLMEVLDPATGEPVADGEFGELVFTSLYHADNPVVRCRVRDGGVYRAAAYCGCGRPFAGLEVASIARTDDLKRVKGVNIFPQAVDDLMYSVAEVDEYEIVLSSGPDAADIATARVMLRTAPADPEAFRENLIARLRTKTGIRFAVELADDLGRSNYKARRWRDERVR
jgi:phenylacetate-CoA ligase